MQIKQNISLKPYHTFAIEQCSHYLVEAGSVDELIEIYDNPDFFELPKLIIGSGSNVLFTQPFSGVVVVNRLSGKTLSEDESFYYIHAQGGEDWPNLVEWSVQQGIGGLENLALIPGCAGSAPIQNIGAYGVEFKDVCQYVDILMLDDFSQRRLSAEECQFGYRDSVFKHAPYNQCVVIAVGLKLPKTWQANNSYGPLQDIAEHELSPISIFHKVCEVRREKLPDPKQVGNAGSFFKNPIIDKAHWQQLKAQFPHIVAYPAGEQMKVAAGWLIDQCDFKGVQVGGAQVHPKQALVLTNAQSCTAQDIIQLASLICDAVWDKYQIALEHEVRFIGAVGETCLSELRVES
ncbi:UDP-N-acetylmuramate dehydrogenase [Vibrio vulnificus]|uniref:UDP-N-acetylmuramate dehydrogenase n=1 Tax=Vibrio vulnificus TaxID=672 RepID=UPI00307E7E76|nr:UDP-N-acetylmuramate dehydrogenase [Vibrio vulnificus]